MDESSGPTYTWFWNKQSSPTPWRTFQKHVKNSIQGQLRWCLTRRRFRRSDESQDRSRDLGKSQTELVYVREGSKRTILLKFEYDKKKREVLNKRTTSKDKISWGIERKSLNLGGACLSAQTKVSTRTLHVSRNWWTSPKVCITACYTAQKYTREIFFIFSESRVLKFCI